MKTAIVLVLNLPLIMVPAACSRRLPAAEGAQTTGDAAEAGSARTVAVSSGPAESPWGRTGIGDNGQYPLPKAQADLETIRRQVRQMKPADLLEIATEHKRLLTETEEAIRLLAKRLQATALTDRLGPEAQKTATQLRTLKEAQAALTSQLDIYLAALKGYGLSLDE